MHAQVLSEYIVHNIL